MSFFTLYSTHAYRCVKKKKNNSITCENLKVFMAKTRKSLTAIFKNSATIVNI